MISHVHSLITGLCLAALAAGCGGGGGGGAPTAPPPAPARTTLILDYEYVEVIEDCDGIEGDGDFHFGVVAHSTEFPIDAAFSEDIRLGPGGKTRAIGRRSYTIDAVDGKYIGVEFSAWEEDKSIFGDVYNDDRLDFESAEVLHEFSNGAWSNLGPQSLTLGSSGCRVRLHWSAGAST